VCVDRSTGRIVFDIKLWDVEKPAFCHPVNSYASPTPAVEAGRVFVHFGSYGTACLDATTGQVIWERRDLPCDHYRGPGSSPIIYQDLLILCFDGFDLQYVVALDKRTGQTVWKKDRDCDFHTTDGDNKKAFGTPTIIQIAGRELLVCPGAVWTMAYDPRTGKEVWRVEHGGMNAAAPPQYARGKLFLCTGDGGLKFLALNPEGQGTLSPSHIHWKSVKGAPARSSPLIVGELMYLFSEAGIATCVEVDTGRQVWQERLSGQFYASPVFADGRIYCPNAEGVTFAVLPGREPKLLASNKLDEGCMATPAPVGHELYLRTKTHLYRLEQK
jgi:outer membrane protein assembly factor BamB